MSLSSKRSLVKHERNFVPDELSASFRDQMEGTLQIYMYGVRQMFNCHPKEKPLPAQIFELDETEFLRELGGFGFLAERLMPDELSEATGYTEPLDYAYELFTEDVREEVYENFPGSRYDDGIFENGVMETYAEAVEDYVDSYYSPPDEYSFASLVQDAIDYTKERRIVHIIHGGDAPISYLFPQREVW